MGVQIYLLDRRTVTLRVDDFLQEIGTLRRFWKVTEIDQERAKEIETAKANIIGKAAPMAVMTADTLEFPLATNPALLAQAHIVIGWDADRSSVTDFGWDYLPVLGFAVRIPGSTEYTLHEDRGGVLYPLAKSRAIEQGILGGEGQPVRHGQPLIVDCKLVKPFISSYVQAECVLTDGQAVELVTSIGSGAPPNPAWYVGKRPVDVERYLAAE